MSYGQGGMIHTEPDKRTQVSSSFTDYLSDERGLIRPQANGFELHSVERLQCSLYGAKRYFASWFLVLNIGLCANSIPQPFDLTNLLEKKWSGLLRWVGLRRLT